MSFSLKICLVAFFILFFGEIAFSQNLVYRKFDQNNGLISNTIYDVKQDKEGFIWIASDLGLQRYDGKSFKYFPLNENKSTSISNILFSKKGDLYVQNFNGQYFKRIGNRLGFQAYLSHHTNFNLGHDFNQEAIAVLAKNEVIILKDETKRYTKIKLEKGYWLSSVNSSPDYFYLSDFQKNKIVKIDKTGKATFQYQKKPFENDFIHWVIDQGNEYFVAKISCSIFDKKANKYFNFSHLSPKAFVQNAALISKNRLAILTTNGVLIYNSTSHTFTRLFDGISCSKIFPDKEGNWWLSTIGSGLYFIPHPEVTVFEENKEFTSLSLDEKSVYVGSKNNMIYRFNIDQNTFENIEKEEINQEVKTLYFSEKLQELLYCSLTFKHKKNGKLVSEIPISVNNIIPLDQRHYLLCESSNLSIYPIENGDEWLKWDSHAMPINQKRMVFFSENKRFLNAVFYRNKILALANDGLWLIQEKTINKLKINNGKDEVSSIFKTDFGVLLGTSSNKIYLFNERGIVRQKKFNSYLKNQTLRKIAFYENHYYLLTNSGLFVLDKKWSLCQKLSGANGFIGLSINNFVVSKSTLFASTSFGFQVIPLKFKKAKFSTINMVLDEFLVNGKATELVNKSIFEPEQNSLSFSFSVLDFKSLGNHTLFYSINGKNWRSTNEKQLNLNELAPGNYTLKIKARNENGFESKILFYEFKLLAPFYQRWWFITIVLIGLGLLGVGLFRLRIRQIQTKNKILQTNLDLEKRLHESTLAAIKSQMNPHFLFNALNTIQSFIYTNEKEAASSYLVDFSDLTRKILEMSNKNTVLLSEEISALRLYLKLEKMRFEDDFYFSIDCEEIPHEAFQIPSMLIQPYVENAIKHGLLHKKGRKRIEIKFAIEDKVLKVSITDNGIGRAASIKINASKEKQHESFATAANEKRFALLNQLSASKIGVKFEDLENDKGQSTGTRVVLSIPISN
ncbi:MAG: hypothetical protein RL264_2698 [Bacteroidota bacterium]|jgi:ligand-binding sensor domain-containing protein